MWLEQGKADVVTERPTADYPAQDTTKAVIRSFKTWQFPVGIVAWDKAGQVLMNVHWYHLADLVSKIR